MSRQENKRMPENFTGLFKESFRILDRCPKINPVIASSGGKDSTLVQIICNEYCRQKGIVLFPVCCGKYNLFNQIEDYKFLKKFCKKEGNELYSFKGTMFFAEKKLDAGSDDGGLLIIWQEEFGKQQELYGWDEVMMGYTGSSSLGEIECVRGEHGRVEISSPLKSPYVIRNGWLPVNNWSREEVKAYFEQLNFYSMRYRQSGIADWQGKAIKVMGIE